MVVVRFNFLNFLKKNLFIIGIEISDANFTKWFITGLLNTLIILIDFHSVYVFNAKLVLFKIDYIIGVVSGEYCFCTVSITIKLTVCLNRSIRILILSSRRTLRTADRITRINWKKGCSLSWVRIKFNITTNVKGTITHLLGLWIMVNWISLST